MASQRRGFAPGLQKICRSPRINQGYVRVEMASLLYGDGCFPRREWQQPQKDGVWEREARFCSDKGDGPLTHTHSGSLKVGNPPSQRHLADPPSSAGGSPSEARLHPPDRLWGLYRAGPAFMCEFPVERRAGPSAQSSVFLTFPMADTDGGAEGGLCD